MDKGNLCYQIIAFLMCIIPVGIIAGLLTIESKSVWLAIILHAVHNNLNQIIYGLKRILELNRIMKKSILMILISGILFIIGAVFGIGGKIGAYVWCLTVFAVAPIAVFLILGQIIYLLVCLHRKKKICWNVIFLLISVVYALPTFVLIGKSPITYPTWKMSEPPLTISEPIEDGIYFGGKDYKTHAYWPAECYAYDVLKEPYDIKSNNLDDYGIYGADIFCPVNGIVVDVKADEADILPNATEYISSLGNYIVIKVENEDAYLILAHLKKDSVLVSDGDCVKEGNLIGKVGNSGTTSEPHLHIQLQRENPMDMKYPVCGEGLPVKFKKS